MTKPFDLGTFQDCLNIYGADFNRWPEDMRGPGQEFLKQDEATQNVYDDALKLDQLMVSGDKPPADLHDKIMKKIED